MSKEYLVEVKVKNNLLYKRIMEKYESVAAFSRAHNLHPNSVGRYLALKQSVVGKRGQINLEVLRICEALNCTPRDVFPAAQWEGALESNTTRREVDQEDMMLLSGRGDISALTCDINDGKDELKKIVNSVLTDLTPREKKVLEMRFGFEGEELTYQEIAIALDPLRPLSNSRVSQIEARALRKLKNPKRSRLLKPYLGEVI